MAGLVSVSSVFLVVVAYVNLKTRGPDNAHE